jgi:hypothetical protein
MEPKKPEGPAKKNPREEAEKQLKNIKVDSQISFEGTIYKVIKITSGKEYVLEPSDPNKVTETVSEALLKEELEKGDALVVLVEAAGDKWTPWDQERLNQLEAQALREESVRTPEKIKTFSLDQIKEIVENYLVSQKSTIRVKELNIEARDNDAIKFSAEMTLRDDYRSQKKGAYTAFAQGEFFNSGDTIEIRGSDSSMARQEMMQKIRENIEKDNGREIENMKIENGEWKVTFK